MFIGKSKFSAHLSNIKDTKCLGMVPSWISISSSSHTYSMGHTHRHPQLLLVLCTLEYLSIIFLGKSPQFTCPPPSTYQNRWAVEKREQSAWPQPPPRWQQVTLVDVLTPVICDSFSNKNKKAHPPVSSLPPGRAKIYSRALAPQVSLRKNFLK
jgi:hypothetical protein